MDPSAGALTVSLDVGPALWLGSDSLVPPGFAAYARVLHPAIRWVDDREVPVRWSQVAAADGRRVDATSTWEAVAGQWAPDGRPGLWDDEPIEGQPAPQQTARLITLLAAFTTDPDRCWYAVWDGYGSLVVPRDGVPRVALGGRSMLLLRPAGGGRYVAGGAAVRPPRQSVVAGGPGLVRRHGHRGDQHDRRRQPGMHRGSARRRRPGDGPGLPVTVRASW